MQLIRIAAVAAGVAALLVSASTQSAPRPAAVAQAAIPAPAADHTLDRADLEAWLDGMVPYALKSGEIAGADVVVVKDGQVLFEKGYGYADVAKKTPMDPARSLIRPGSTSKLFTWTAVMQLVQAGKLDLDRDVDAYLDFKIPHKDGKSITLRDLMNHRAGFEEGLKGILSTDPHGLETTEQYLERHPRPLLFTPGEVPAYSNYGAALAGYIVERVSGEPFERYVERHIFLPLGMTRSTFDQPLPGRFRPDLAQGYMTASGAPHAYELIVTRPAGSVTTTADDMSRFMIAHLQQGRFGDYQMLSPETEKLMQTPSETGLPGFATMAHGLFWDVHNGRTVVGHGGDTIVFHTEMDLIPEAGVGIFYTFNSRGSQDAVYLARQALFDGFMDRYFPASGPRTDPPVLASASKDAQEIAGLYQSSRRVEHGFLSVFYLLQQTAITPNADGTITAPGSLERGQATFREVAPQVWRQVGGTRQLALTRVHGVKTVIDSEDPTSVLQAVPVARASSLNLPVLLGSFAILAWTLLLWPLSPLLRRGERAASGLAPEVRRLRLFVRGAAAVDMAWLFGWFLLLQPVLGEQLEVYNAGLDPAVRALQIAGLPVIAAAGVGVWSAWRMFKLSAPWLGRLWTLAVAAALVGFVWIGLMGQLMSFTLNY